MKKRSKFAKLTKKLKRKLLANLSGWHFWFLLIIFILILGLAIFCLVNCLVSKKDQNNKSDITSIQYIDYLTEGLTKNYFGDNFSSPVFIDSHETNFFLDSNVTAYMFTPVYDLKNVEVADSNLVSLAETTYQKVKGNNYCLANGCLSLKDGQLFFNQKEIDLPSELEKLKDDGKIVSLNIGSLESKWLLGAVIGDKSDEYCLVYYFDGNSFKSVISLTSAVKMQPKYERRGGTMSFGGQDSDFIILYSGYNGLAYRVRESAGQENFTNLSKFFGLRVTDEGFNSQIIKIGQGENTSWFVCGQNNKSFKMIKLWQNETDNIVGAVDLGNIAFGANQLSTVSQKDIDPAKLSLVCFSELEAGDEVENSKIILSFFPFRPDDFDNDAKPDLALKLTDFGFDNNHDYQIVSNNLNSKGKATQIVVVKDFGFSGNYQFEISNDKIDWRQVKLKKIISFSDKNATGLYWRLLADKGKNNYYSPYLDHINAVEYYYLAN